LGEQGFEIWAFDLERGSRSQVTHGADGLYPVWHPDGRLTFAALRTGNYRIYVQSSDAAVEPEMLFDREGEFYPGSWSLGGRFLAYTDWKSERNGDIWLFDANNDLSIPFQTTAFNELSPEFTPDGPWLAYVSDESGQQEVYVQPVPATGERWKVSSGGGRAPAWSGSGQELFYRRGRGVYVVALGQAPGFRAGRPQLLFEGDFEPPSTGGNPYYGVAPDGQRFVMLKSDTVASERQLHVLTDFLGQLGEGLD